MNWKQNVLHKVLNKKYFMNIRLYTNSSFSSILSRGYSQILSLIFADNQDVIFCDYLRSDLRNSARN
jgi:hypothetical protein